MHLNAGFLMLALGLVLAPEESLVKEPFSPADRARLGEILRWPAVCESEHQAAVEALEIEDGRVRFFALGGKRYLVAVGCAHGSYQPTSMIYLYDESLFPPRGTLVTVPSLNLQDDEEEIDRQWVPAERAEVVGEVSFDPDAVRLTIFTRYRGLGDCGLLVRYVLKADRLVAKEFRGRDCDGDPERAPAPEDWPLIVIER